MGTILAASLVAAEKVRTAQDVFKEVNGRLEREFISVEGLLLDYVGDIPEAKEIAELGPLPCRGQVRGRVGFCRIATRGWGNMV